MKLKSLNGVGRVLAARVLPAIALAAASLLVAVPTALAEDTATKRTTTCGTAGDRDAAGQPCPPKRIQLCGTAADRDAAGRPCPPKAPAQAGQGGTRVGYCSVAGNSLNGQPLAPGTFLNLVIGQNETDANFEGALIAIYVEGVGATCDAPPDGFASDGVTLVDGQGHATGADNAIYPLFSQN